MPAFATRAAGKDRRMGGPVEFADAYKRYRHEVPGFIPGIRLQVKRLRSRADRR